ncbi:MAG: hydantoinase/oxoprolinase family protein [Anaerolineales bacterium]|nr:MAG: hydantoinase/oxoprolinase family protein [Anaerolineales bacterium]
MAILLGIDTGGTYTDAVLYDDSTDTIISSAKALTTKHDLSIGIRGAVEAVLPTPPPDIRLVSLSTTLATNAIVEGQGSPVCLLLLGYPPDALNRSGLRQALGDAPVIFIEGGHTVTGEEQAPLDLDATRHAIQTHAPGVAAFGVSGYFAVRNPSHELAVRRLARELTQLPVTCGHELTSNLDAPRRALTVTLNARLIPLLQGLILAVRDMLVEREIHAPLMVVKGDGSLIDAAVALERPVETILSGPAASVVGARHLSGEDDVFVVDMGGTTTDIALLRNGRPMLDLDGATVGGWRTMVEAVAVHTLGLGGDSEVRLDRVGEVHLERVGQIHLNGAHGLVVGPQRVVPLSLLAHQHAEILDSLRRQLAAPVAGPDHGQFVLRQRSLDSGRASLTETQGQIWDRLAAGPQALPDLFRDSRTAYFQRRALARLVERGLVVISAFTPTDAAHVLGYHHDWSIEAARLGAELCARRASAPPWELSRDVEDFCRQVIGQVAIQSGRALVTAALAETYGLDLKGDDLLRRLFVDQALAGDDGEDSLVQVALTLRRPLVAIGAPVRTYYPAVAESLHTRLHIPQHAEIANALGAVAGGVMQTVRALIKPLEDERFRVHLPIGIHDFADLEEAAAYALEEASMLAGAQARRAGAVGVQVQTRREDHIVRLQNEDVYFDTEITATAVGRPRLGN